MQEPFSPISTGAISSSTATADEAATYRYHSLFRTFLRAELMLERPDEIRGLHRIVASSSVGRGTVTERIGHAIGARDWPLTAEAATDAWPQLTLLEPPGTIRKLMDRPPAVRRRHPTLAVLDAIDLVQRGELEEGSARLDEAARAPSDPRRRCSRSAGWRSRASRATWRSSSSVLASFWSRARPRRAPAGPPVARCGQPPSRSSVPPCSRGARSSSPSLNSRRRSSWRWPSLLTSPT